MTTKKTEPKQLGDLHIDVIDMSHEDREIPYDISLKTSGKLDTRIGMVALISSLGMIVEDTVRTGMAQAFKDVSSDEEIAELQDLVLSPLMDLLGSQLGLIESSLAYIMSEVDAGDPQVIRELFTNPPAPETTGDNNDGEQSE